MAESETFAPLKNVDAVKCLSRAAGQSVLERTLDSSGLVVVLAPQSVTRYKLNRAARSCAQRARERHEDRPRS
jgi:hypothetical protein